MSREQLSRLLSDMADDAKPASVHQRAAAKSRRIATGRATLAAIVTLGVASGAVFGVSAFATNQSSPAANDDKLDGELVFTASSPEETKVWSWQIGEEPQELVSGLHAVADSIELAPDGQHLAYAEGKYDGSHSEPTTVHVVDLATGKDVPLPDSVPGIADVPGTDGEEWEKLTYPTWAPDSQRLWLNAGADHTDGEYGFVDIDSGEFTKSQDPAEGGTDTTVVDDAEGKDMLVTDQGEGKYTAVNSEGAQTDHKVEPEGDFGKPKSEFGEDIKAPVCETEMSAGTCQIMVHDDESEEGFSLIFQDQVGTAVSGNATEQSHSSAAIGEDHFVNLYDKRANLTVKDKKGETATELDTVDLPKEILTGDDRDFASLVYRR